MDPPPDETRDESDLIFICDGVWLWFILGGRRVVLNSNYLILSGFHFLRGGGRRGHDQIRSHGCNGIRQDQIESELEAVEDGFVRLGDGHMGRISRQSHGQSNQHRRHRLLRIKSAPIGALEQSGTETQHVSNRQFPLILLIIPIIIFC